MESTVKKIEEYIDQGRFLEAHSMAKNTLDYDPDNLRLKQIYGLSLSKSGAFKNAQEYLEELHSKYPEDEETAGILGGVYKELFKITENPKYAFLSRDIYLKNFNITNSYYTGINAASMSVIGGAARAGREIALRIIESLDNDTTEFWEIATLGEAYLLSRDYETAYQFYNKARDIASNKWGWILSVYNQVNLLNHFIRIPQNIRDLYQSPGIVAFVGHMVDHPDRENPRFPAYIEDDIKRSIKADIQSLNARIGFCSLACGSDIIFAEAMLETGAELHVFLPFKISDFMELSVKFANADWEQRFNRIIDHTSIKYITKDPYGGNDMLFNILGRVIFGSTFIKGKTLRTKPSLLTVLSDSDLSRKTGGSRDLMELWPYKDTWQNINPDKYRDSEKEAILISEKTKATSEAEQEKQEELSTEEVETKSPKGVYCAIYTRIITKGDEDGMAIWEDIRNQVKEWFLKPIVYDTHHHNLISVYRSTQSAAEYAFFIKDFVEKNYDIGICSGIHMGPFEIIQKGEKEKIVPMQDPHMTKLSAIVHYAIPGSIYTSEIFSSVLSLESKDYNFGPVGTIQIDEILEAEEVFNLTRKVDDANL